MARVFLYLNVVMWLLFVGTAAHAQSQNLNYSIAESPDWVITQNYDPNGFKDLEHGNAPYLLYSWQIKLTDQNKESYSREARRVDNVEGAESASQITIDFDPSYQKLELHSLTVTRDGKAYNRLNKKTFKLYRVETEADRLIYNGTVTASTVLDDIRVGDIVEYAYTVKGRNDYFKGNIGYYFKLQYGVPIDRHFVRLVVPDDRTYQTRLYAGAKKPTTLQVGSHKIYEWAFDQQLKKDTDDNSPSWFTSYPAFQISDKPDWADVGRWKAAQYGPPKKISSELKTEIDNIAKRHSDPKKRTEAVLKFVQSEIRYLGIEIGSGGYIPRDPSKILERRFGDCKDKTRLMVTMLDRLGIEANALLIHTDQRQGIDEYLPNLGAFDHVITHVTIDGKSYFLDGTKGEQIGNLDKLEQSYYDKGVIVGENSAGLIDVNPHETMPYSQDTVETFSFGETSKTVQLEVITKLYGGAADRSLRWRANKGADDISKTYLEHYQKSYANVEVNTPIKFEIHPTKAMVEITERYTIPDAWEQDDDEDPNFNLEFEAYPTSIADPIPENDKTPRTDPIAIKHKTSIRHKLVFNLPEGWGFDIKNSEIENDSFYFQKTTNFTNDIYSETYTYRSKQDHIAPDKIQKTMKDIDKIDDVYGLTLTSGDQYQTIEQKTEGQLFSEGTWIALALLAGIIYIGALIFGMVKAVIYDKEWRAEAEYYPVALWKFLLLTTVSFGVYWIFWIYKNWYWLRTVREEEVSPFWRTFFHPFMNFSLFGYMSEDEGKGMSGFGILAVPLAIAILAAQVLSRFTETWDDVPTWLIIIELFTIYLLIPAVTHVNTMNGKNNIAYQNNSKMTWHSYAFIAMFIPLLILIFIGLFMPE